MRPQSTLRKKRFSRPRGVKAMHADGLDWGEVGRPLGRASLGREVIETEIAAAADRHLGEGGAMQRGLGGRAAKLSQVA